METLTGHALPARDGFELRVELQQDYEWNIYDAGLDRSAADLAAWNRMDWLYVGVVVIASREDQQLGDASLWQVPHGVMGDGVRVDAFGPGGAFATYREQLIIEAVAHAISTLRGIDTADDEASTEPVWGRPDLSKLEMPEDPRFPWQITWPDGATSTYRRRRDAEHVLLTMILDLW